MKFSTSTKVIWGVALLLVIEGVSFFWIDAKTSFFSQQGNYVLESDSSHHVEREIVLPVFLHGMVINNLHIVEDEVKRNQR